MPIDQAEEILNSENQEEREQFFKIVQYLVEKKANFFIVWTLRSDQLNVYQAQKSLEFLRDKERVYILNPIASKELHNIIQEPAFVNDVMVKDDVVEAIKEDTKTTTSLPLLAYLLQILYKNITLQQQKTITMDNYKALAKEGKNPIENIINQEADEIYATHKNKKEIEELFVNHLVKINQDESFSKRSEMLNNIPSTLHALVDRFVQKRLLIKDTDKEGQVTVEIVHEALITNWSVLKDWLNKERGFLILKSQLFQSLKEWEDTDRNDKALLFGLRLENAVKYKEKLNDKEQGYVERSLKYDKKIKRKKSVMVSLFIIIVSLLAIYGFWQKGVAEKKSKIVKSELYKSLITQGFVERDYLHEPLKAKHYYTKSIKYSPTKDKYNNAITLSSVTNNIKLEAFFDLNNTNSFISNTKNLTKIGKLKLSYYKNMPKNSFLSKDASKIIFWDKNIVYLIDSKTRKILYKVIHEGIVNKVVANDEMSKILSKSFNKNSEEEQVLLSDIKNDKKILNVVYKNKDNIFGIDYLISISENKKVLIYKEWTDEIFVYDINSGTLLTIINIKTLKEETKKIADTVSIDDILLINNTLILNFSSNASSVGKLILYNIKTKYFIGESSECFGKQNIFYDSNHIFTYQSCDNIKTIIKSWSFSNNMYSKVSEQILKKPSIKNLRYSFNNKLSYISKNFLNWDNIQIPHKNLIGYFKDKNKIVTISKNKIVKIWTVKNLEKESVSKDNIIYNDGNFSILFDKKDAKIKLFNNRKELSSYYHSQKFNDIIYTFVKQDYIYSIAYNNNSFEVIVWDFNKNKKIFKEIILDSEGFEVINNGKYLVKIEKEYLKVWNLYKSKKIYILKRKNFSYGFSNFKLAIFDNISKKLVVYDLDTQKEEYSHNFNSLLFNDKIVRLRFYANSTKLIFTDDFKWDILLNKKINEPNIIKNKLATYYIDEDKNEKSFNIPYSKEYIGVNFSKTNIIKKCSIENKINEDTSIVKFFDMRVNKLLFTFKHNIKYKKYFYFIHNNLFFSFVENGNNHSQLIIWDMENNKQIFNQSFNKSFNEDFNMYITPDKDKIFICFDMLELWSIKDKKKIFETNWDGQIIFDNNNLKFISMDNIFSEGERYKEVLVKNFINGKILFRFVIDERSVDYSLKLKFCNNDKWICSESNGYISIWDIESRKKILPKGLFDFKILHNSNFKYYPLKIEMDTGTYLKEDGEIKFLHRKEWLEKKEQYEKILAKNN